MEHKRPEAVFQKNNFFFLFPPFLLIIFIFFFFFRGFVQRSKTWGAYLAGIAVCGTRTARKIRYRSKRPHRTAPDRKRIAFFFFRTSAERTVPIRTVPYHTVQVRYVLLVEKYSHWGILFLAIMDRLSTVLDRLWPVAWHGIQPLYTMVYSIYNMLPS